LLSKRVKFLSGGAALAAVVLAGVVGRHLQRAALESRLPAPAAYSDRPAIFRSSLGQARARVLANSFRADDLRSLAHLYQANRLNVEAGACYRLIAEGRQPEDSYYLAEIAEDAGDLDQAAVELELTLKGDPVYLPARLQLADVLFKAGHPDEAERAYRAILEVAPDQPQAMFGLARIELQRKQDDAAIALLGRLMLKHPEMTSGAALLAQVFDRRGEKSRADAMTKWSRQKPEPVPPDPWDDALLLDCYDIQRLGLKFEEYFTSGEIELALPLLGRVEALDPNSAIPPLLRGWSKARDHDDRGAILEYRQALDRGGDPEKICPYLVQSLLTLGETDAAAALLAEFHAKKPDSIPILISYADVVVRQGDAAKAKQLLIQVVEREPFLTSANLSLARILWAEGQRDAAAQCLERVIKVSADDVASRATLAQYYLGKSDPNAAIGPLVEAVAIERNPTLGKNLTGMLYSAYLSAGQQAESAGHGEAAVSDYYNEAVALAPELPAAYALKAKACAGLQRLDEAAAALKKLAQLQPGNPTVLLGLGDIAKQQGHDAEAVANWRRALALAGDRVPALRAALLDRLKGSGPDSASP
jgi:tetratricopeptide (TPR) repeat protein